MCPSYLATRDEKDSTRGRARVLQEALDGSLVQGLADPAVPRRSTSAWPARAARPTARPAWTWRRTRPRRCTRSTTSEGVRRPRSHRLLGRLPAVGATRAAPVAPAGQPDDAARPGGPAGQGDRRHRPAALDPGVRADDAAQVGADRERRDDARTSGSGPTRSATTSSPATATPRSATSSRSGLTARVIPDDACCGLTWITTGQLDQARAIMERTVRDAARRTSSPACR